MANPADVLEAEFLKKINDMADLIFQLSQENLIKDGKLDTANLLKSGNVNRLPDGAQIVYTAPYAEDVEFGRTANKVEESVGELQDNLDGWVKRKLGIKDVKKRRTTAFFVARAIKKRGIQPSPYLKPAAEKGLIESGFGVTEVRL